MKKIYMTPKTQSVLLKTEKVLGNLSGDGVSVKISGSASGDAESRKGWIDDED